MEWCRESIGESGRERYEERGRSDSSEEEGIRRRYRERRMHREVCSVKTVYGYTARVHNARVWSGVVRASERAVESGTRRGAGATHRRRRVYGGGIERGGCIEKYVQCKQCMGIHREYIMREYGMVS